MVGALSEMCHPDISGPLVSIHFLMEVTKHLGDVTKREISNLQIQSETSCHLNSELMLKCFPIPFSFNG